MLISSKQELSIYGMETRGGWGGGKEVEGEIRFDDTEMSVSSISKFGIPWLAPEFDIRSKR